MKSHKHVQGCALVLLWLALSACQSTPFPNRDGGHINQTAMLASDAAIPPVLEQALPPASTEPTLTTATDDRYTLIAHDLPAEQALLGLAQDAEFDLDIADSIDARITIHAVDKSLPHILERIASLAGIRYRIQGQRLLITRDSPYLKTYAVPYLNIQRRSQGRVSLSVALDAPVAEASRQGANNGSSAAIENQSVHDFWEGLKQTLEQIIALDKAHPGQLIINREASLVSVVATQALQREVQQYLDQLLRSVRRQILIEATIVEVNLNRRFDRGIDWRRVAESGRLVFEQSALAPDLAAQGNGFGVAYQASDNNFVAALRLLEQFGDVSVLSSPRLMALNNQPAMLKVVNNQVYFTLDVDSTTASGGATTTSVETTINTVPVGLSMMLTPYIDENDEILLSIRPTISRILRFVNDPSPALAQNNIVSAVPEIQVREMETMLRLNSGQVAVLGGLMQDTTSNETEQLPGLARLPLLGHLFRGSEKRYEKSELVIFLRPVRVRQPDINSDLNAFTPYLPEV